MIGARRRREPARRRAAPGRLLVLPALLLSCGGGADGGKLRWKVSYDEPPGAIMSFWGGSTGEVFAAGGDLAAGGGQGYVWRYDGSRWTRADVPAPTLWWIHGFGAADLWAVGDRGTVIHNDGSAWRVVETGGDYTLWGVWGPSPSRIWTVGGSVLGGRPGVVRVWDGASFADVTGVDTTGELFFKVWGSAEDDVDVVGERGTVMHWDGAAWSKTTAAPGRLLTVRGRDRSDVFAVGGISEGIVIHRDATGTWSRVDVGQVPGLMGIWTAPGQPVLLTGFSGVMMLGDGNGWHQQDAVTPLCLHAAWSDGRGTWFAGGGDLFQPGSPRGVILVGR